MRIEISINGEKKCIAGLGGYGVLNSILTWVKRDPEKVERNNRKGADYLQFSEESLDLTVSGLTSDDDKTDAHLHWINEALSEGDEITIRVLAPGQSDEPVSYRAKNA